MREVGGGGAGRWTGHESVGAVLELCRLLRGDGSWSGSFEFEQLREQQWVFIGFGLGILFVSFLTS